jgi:hypothetical protein
MKGYNNTYTQKIHAALIPLVGEIVAHGIIKTQSSKLGKTEESLTHLDGPQIAEGMRKGLLLFVGSEAASQVAMKIVQIR